MLEGQDFIDDFLCGPDSFATRLDHSRRLQQVWAEMYPGMVDGWEDFKTIGYAPQRFKTRSDILGKCCVKLIKVFGFYKVLSDDPDPSHREDKIWGTEKLTKWCNYNGFKKFVNFGIDADYATITYNFRSLPQDRRASDIAIDAGKLLETLDVVDAVLREGRAFMSGPDNNTYTGIMLMHLKGDFRAYFGHRTGVIGRPSDPAEYGRALDECQEYARQVADMCKMLWEAHFPHFEWRAKFGCYNCSETKGPDALRIGCLRDIANAERVCPDKAAQQFESMLPVSKTLRKRFECNIKIWTELSEACRERPAAQFLPSRREFLACTFSYLCMLDKTSECERNCSIVQLIEEKRRERKCDIVTLTETVKIALEIPDDLEQLLIRVKTRTGCMDWKCRELLQQAQRNYAEFYGERALQARKADGEQRTTSKASIRLPPVVIAKAPTAKRPLIERKLAWSASVGQIRADSKATSRFQMLTGASVITHPLAHPLNITRPTSSIDRINFLKPLQRSEFVCVLGASFVHPTVTQRSPMRLSSLLHGRQSQMPRSR